MTDLRFREITKLAEKQKWQRQFLKAYSGLALESHKGFYSENNKFIVVEWGGKDVGFARINDKSEFFVDFTDRPVWNLTDAYVKPPYRGNGILAALIRCVVTNHAVLMMLIETRRNLEHRKYYSDLGFTYFYAVRDGTLTWAFQSDFEPTVRALNASSKDFSPK